MCEADLVVADFRVSLQQLTSIVTTAARVKPPTPGFRQETGNRRFEPQKPAQPRLSPEKHAGLHKCRAAPVCLKIPQPAHRLVQGFPCPARPGDEAGSTMAGTQFGCPLFSQDGSFPAHLTVIAGRLTSGRALEAPDISLSFVPVSALLSLDLRPSKLLSL